MKKNKILIFVFIFFALLIGFTSSCFAVDYSHFTTTQGADIQIMDFSSLVDENDLFYIELDKVSGQTNLYIYHDLKDVDGAHFVWMPPEPGVDTSTMQLFDSSGKNLSVLTSKYFCSSSDTKWYLSSSDTGTVFWSNKKNNDTIFSFDVKDPEGKVVFQKAPQLKGGVLVPVVEKVEMNKVLEEILVILPVVIMTIVGLIGLRKALKTLFNFLHKA